MNALRTLLAFARRDFLVATSYRVGVGLDMLTAFAALFTTWFVGVTVGQAPLLAGYGGEYFPFAVLGIAAVSPMNAALEGMSKQIRDAQLQGTLEPILVTPLGAARAVLYSSAYGVISSFGRMVVFLGAAALLFDLPVHVSRLPVAAAALLLGVAAYAALGLLSAAFTLLLKRGDPVALVIQQVSALLGGVIFPIEALPDALQQVAWALPVTHALHALRMSLLMDAPTAAILPMLGGLALFTAVATPVAWGVFRWALHRAKDEGSLTHY